MQLITNYWRVRAATALYRGAKGLPTGSLQYDNVPRVGAIGGLPASETIAVALSSLQQYVTTRLPRDFFLALIAEFEIRLISRLATTSYSTSGTLGKLQKSVQNAVSLPVQLIEDLDEIRLRRNAMIHHNGVSDADYVNAASKVHPRASLYIAPPTLGSSIIPDEIYLTYAADVMIRYSNAL